MNQIVERVYLNWKKNMVFGVAPDFPQEFIYKERYNFWVKNRVNIVGHFFKFKAESDN